MNKNFKIKLKKTKNLKFIDKSLKNFNGMIKKRDLLNTIIYYQV